jgi:hypothetical protein
MFNTLAIASPLNSGFLNQLEEIMNRTKILLVSAVLTLSTPGWAQQPLEQNINYHEVRTYSLWVWSNISSFCVARPYTLVCDPGL